MGIKTKILIIVIILFTGFTVGKNVRAAISIHPMLNTGLVGYWAMDEGAGTVINDQSGNRNTGTASNSPVWADGRLGRAMSFDGNNSIQISGLLGQPANVTLSAWANLSSADSEGAEVISLGDNLALRLDHSTNGTEGFFYTGTEWITTQNNTDYAGAGWHYYTYVFDDTNDLQTLYVDGVSTATTNSAASIGYGVGTNTFIGMHGNGETNNDFNGSIDEVRIYNRALSAAEVARLYNLTQQKFKAASSQGLVGYWSMDEGAGTITGDMSGKGKNGTLNGASWTSGKRGQALDFDGTGDYINLGNVYSSVNTISFWIQASTTTNRIIDLNGTAKVELSSGTITTSGITSPTIYVDGAVSSTLDTNWHYVTITTDTGIDSSAVKVGQGDSWACGDALSYNGDSYATVQMSETYGSQCWFQENLRTTQKPNGDALTSYCNPSGCGSSWGRFYDWNTAMNGATTATGCGAKIQGICPAGWHVPSGFWGCATDDFYALGIDSGALKKVNTDTNVPWDEPNTGATNASNWTGYPAGQWAGGYYWRGSQSYYWSSAELDGANAYFRGESYNTTIWNNAFCSKTIFSFSLRCVKDAPPTSYFSGKLDEVRMYNRVLSPTEATNSYTASKKIFKVSTSQNNKMTDGLIGMWSFNGPDMSGTTVFDRSSQGNNGTLVNGPVVTIGKVGQAIDLSGSTQRVFVGTQSSLDNNNTLTWTAWARAEGNPNNNYGPVFEKGNGSNERKKFQFSQSDPGSTMNAVSATFFASTTNAVSQSVNGTYSLNEWAFWTVTYDDNGDRKIRIYKNAEEVTYLTQQAAVGALTDDASQFFIIGGQPPSGFYSFNGVLDEARVYNRVLTAAEIKRMYEMGK